MEITFIRHGFSEHNLDMLLETCNNEYSNLTKGGIDHCYKVRSNLPEFDVVVTSSLLRALQTTKILFEGKMLKIYVTNACRTLGHIQNKRITNCEIEKLYPEYDMTYMSCDFDENDITSKIIALDILIKDLNEMGYKKLAVVSHSSFITKYLNIDMAYINYCETWEHNLSPTTPTGGNNSPFKPPLNPLQQGVKGELFPPH